MMPAVIQEQQTIRRALMARRRVRDGARRRESDSVDQIAGLLVEGREHGLTIKEMSDLAGITRQTAYTLIERVAGARR
jgi:predicted transcriptional regulator